MAPKPGDSLPDVELVGKTPGEKVKLSALGSKVAIFAVPGSFTPGCSKTHLPGFVERAESLREAGADAIVCISVNDPFVHQAWGEAHGAQKAGIQMLADPRAEFTKALGEDVVLDATEALGGLRSKRLPSFALFSFDSFLLPSARGHASASPLDRAPVAGGKLAEFSPGRLWRGRGRGRRRRRKRIF